jgi:regulator of replication initiation timing
VTAARERRKEARVERRNTAEYEIQVETLSPVVLENLVRNYRSELNENEKLRVELRELKQLMENPEESEEDGLSVGSTCGESEVDTEVEMETTQGASFSEGEGETPRQ